MLDSMTRREWLEWQVFLSLEPLPGVRDAALVASVVQEMRNGRRTKQTDPIVTLQDCLLRFGDDLPPGPKRATDWKAMKAKFIKAVMPPPQRDQQPGRQPRLAPRRRADR